MFSKKVLIILSFISIYLIWGSTYMFNKIAVAEIQPMFLGSIRFGVAGILILIICRLMKLPLKISKKELRNVAIAGFLFLVYGNGMYVWALQYVDSGFGALIASTQPLFILLLLRLIDGKKMQLKSIIGVGLGIVGIYLLVSQKNITTSDKTMLGIFMMLTCVLSWSFGSVFVSKAELPKKFFVSTGYQMTISGVLLFILSFVFGEEHSLPIVWSNQTKFSVVFLLFFGSIIAFTTFNYLLKNVSPEKVATSAYVNPIIAMILGAIVLNEQFSNQSIIASMVLLTGVYFINSRKRQTKKVTTKPQKI